MEKRDYRAIAKILAESDVTLKDDNWVLNKFDLAADLADYFEKEERLFNRKKFLEDCGVA